MKNLVGGKIALLITVVAASLLSTTVAGLFIVPTLAPTVGAANAFGTGIRPTLEPTPVKEQHPQPGMMYPFKERIVNLTDPGGIHFLKIELALEYDLPDLKGAKAEAYKKRQEEFIKEMASRKPILDDVITTILAGKTWSSLLSAEGKENLREELKATLAEASGEHKLLNVYFTQFVIQ